VAATLSIGLGGSAGLGPEVAAGDEVGPEEATGFTVSSPGSARTNDVPVGRDGLTGGPTDRATDAART